MDEQKKSLIWVSFKCAKCDKPILGHKHMKIKSKHYHMTCGMSIKFGEKVRA